jgi:hypothetical protein
MVGEVQHHPCLEGRTLAAQVINGSNEEKQKDIIEVEIKSNKKNCNFLN